MDPTTTEAGDVGEDESWMIQRDGFKEVADAAFRSGDFATAIQEYTAALSLDPTNGRLLSNRSAAFLKSNQKSKALADAKACVETNTMGNKGVGRYAAALQALGRWGPALEQWERILSSDKAHAVALKGKEDCERMIQVQRKHEEEKKEAAKAKEEKATKEEQQKEHGEEDDLDDFFDDVEEAAETVVKEKLREAIPEHIKHDKTILGSAEHQIKRLIPNTTTYKWYNLNPFHVLDIPHTADEKDISRRYKALSLLLHPDKNPGLENAQLAFDQVLAAKEMLDDEDKAAHVRELVAQGMKLGHKEYQATKQHDMNATLEACQKKAVHKLFADLEVKRREVEQRQRAYQQREQQQEDDDANKEKSERKFDKSWKQEERVDKRVGSWRTFQSVKKTKKN